MQVQLNKELREVLNDRKASKQLGKNLRDGRYDTTITTSGNKSYTLMKYDPKRILKG